MQTKRLLFIARPWVYFLWVPALAIGWMLAYQDLGATPPSDLFGLMAAAVFSAMLGQHFFHVAGGSSSTREWSGGRNELIAYGLLLGSPAVSITLYLTFIRGVQILLLFLIGVAFVVGYSIPAIKSEWYWGLGQGIVTVTTYNVLTGEISAHLIPAAIGVSCLYYNMLHSARLAEGDYDDAETKREKGYFIQRYAFFVGAMLLPLSFVV